MPPPRAIGSARAKQDHLLPLFDEMLYSMDFPEGFRVGVEQRGIRLGKSRQPLTELQRQDRTALGKRLGKKLSELGYSAKA